MFISIRTTAKKVRKACYHIFNHIYTSNDLDEYAQIENNGSKRAIIHSDGATMMIGADSTWLYVP